MEHGHNIPDSDPRFRIDADSRSIQNVGETSTILFQYDHNSERLTFELPRMIDGHDMSLCDIVQVHYVNTDSATHKELRDVYEVNDLQVSPDDEDVVICSWLVSSNATRYVGTLAFALSFKCSDDSGEIIYSWNTAVNNNVVVSSTLNNGGAVVAQYSDVLEAWRLELFSMGFSGLIDVSSGRVYKLYTKDGKLMMTEVTE